MWGEVTYPSVLAHNKLGPNTIAMLLGVILLTSLVWASFARNLIKYLGEKREENICRNSILQPRVALVLSAEWSRIRIWLRFCILQSPVLSLSDDRLR